MFYLMPPRHISTLPIASFWPRTEHFRCSPINGHSQGAVGMSQTCHEETHAPQHPVMSFNHPPRLGHVLTHNSKSTPKLTHAESIRPIHNVLILRVSSRIAARILSSVSGEYGFWITVKASSVATAALSL
jgi:hypothetical protein